VTTPPQRDYERLHNFRFAIRSFLHFSEQASRSAGIDPQQHQLMLAIKARGGEDGLPIADVAERLQIRHNTAVELIDRAEARSVVTRTPSPDDGRKVLVRLTQDGEDLLRTLSLHHLAELQQAAPALVEVLTDITSPLAAPTPQHGGSR
jgi:DNA-binding MarR family transcriptional regulator